MTSLMNHALISWDTSDSTVARCSSPNFLFRCAISFACGRSANLWHMKSRSIPGMSTGLQAKRSALVVSTRSISALTSWLEVRPTRVIRQGSAPSVTVVKGLSKVGRPSSNSALGSRSISPCPSSSSIYSGLVVIST